MADILPNSIPRIDEVRTRRVRFARRAVSKIVLAAMLASTVAVPIAAAPLTAGFDRLPFPAERKAQAKQIRDLLEAVDRADESRFAAALTPGATLKRDAGVETPLDLRGFQQLLAGCEQVWDFAIPNDKDKLGIVWKCGAGLRAARFRLIGGRIAAVHASTNYVTYAPPPPPPPPPPLTAAQLEEMRRRNAVTAVVRDHFVLLARKDAAELAAFFPQIASIPVISEGAPTTLGEFYQREMLPEDGRQVTVRGCRAAADFERSGRVECKLHIDRAAQDAQMVRSSYNLGYVVKGKRVERVFVVALPTAQASN